ncbi:MAG: NAD-dependent epimerase/dehydratase family protein, partial [Acidimicrobiia bacterium]
MPRAVVTGGAGFVGAHLCRTLRQRGWDVVAVDDLSTGSADHVADLDGDDGFTLVVHDVVDGIPV